MSRCFLQMAWLKPCFGDKQFFIPKPKNQPFSLLFLTF